MATPVSNREADTQPHIHKHTGKDAKMQTRVLNRRVKGSTRGEAKCDQELERQSEVGQNAEMVGPRSGLAQEQPSTEASEHRIGRAPEWPSTETAEPCVVILGRCTYVGREKIALTRSKEPCTKRKAAGRP